MSKIIAAWKEGHIQLDTKSNVDAVARTHGEPVSLAPVDWKVVLLSSVARSELFLSCASPLLVFHPSLCFGICLCFTFLLFDPVLVFHFPCVSPFLVFHFFLCFPSSVFFFSSFFLCLSFSLSSPFKVPFSVLTLSVFFHRR